MQPKHLAIKLLSLLLIGWGVFGLIGDVQATFKLISQTNRISLKTSSLHQTLVLQLIVLGLSNFITTTYGLFLLAKPTHLLQFMSLILGFLLFGLTLYLNQHPDRLFSFLLNLAHLNQ